MALHSTRPANFQKTTGAVRITETDELERRGVSSSECASCHTETSGVPASLFLVSQASCGLSSGSFPESLPIQPSFASRLVVWSHDRFVSKRLDPPPGVQFIRMPIARTTHRSGWHAPETWSCSPRGSVHYVVSVSPEKKSTGRRFIPTCPRPSSRPKAHQLNAACQPAKNDLGRGRGWVRGQAGLDPSKKRRA